MEALRKEIVILEYETKDPYILIEDTGQGLLAIEKVAHEKAEYVKFLKFWGYRQKADKFYALFEKTEE